MHAAAKDVDGSWRGLLLLRRWPWTASLALHLALVIGGVFIAWRVIPGSEDPGPPVEVSFFDPKLGSGPQTPMTSETPPRMLLPAPSEAMPRPPAITLPSATAPAQQNDAPSEEAPQALPSVPEAAQRLARRYPEVRFAGLGASSARDIVYVVDASGSMISSLPIVNTMLRESLGQLSSTQRFQVFFFQDGDYLYAPHPGDGEDARRQKRLIRATRENLEVVSQWLDRVRPRGTSSPIAALQEAAALRPDAIFILSRAIGEQTWGATKGQVMTALEQINPADARTGNRPMTIKTIQFLEEDPSGMLRFIGERHGGSNGYMLITRDEITKRGYTP
ncbi:MAG: hypothetical protein KDA20_05765 [Phycisphaerales bacterium]|nr:hypothetical protein [Phycisphaerales bacterium]